MGLWKRILNQNRLNVGLIFPHSRRSFNRATPKPEVNPDEKALTTVTIYDIVEKTIDMIAQPQHKLKGLVQFDYSNEKLQPGLYICVIEMNGKSYTERIIQFKKIQLLEFCYTEVNQIFK